jgi:hypothetical protein
MGDNSIYPLTNLCEQPSAELTVKSLSDERMENVLGLPSVAYVSTSSLAGKQCGSASEPCDVLLNFDFGVLKFCGFPGPS